MTGSSYECDVRIDCIYVIVDEEADKALSGTVRWLLDLTRLATCKTGKDGLVQTYCLLGVQAANNLDRNAGLSAFLSTTVPTAAWEIVRCDNHGATFGVETSSAAAQSPTFPHFRKLLSWA